MRCIFEFNVVHHANQNLKASNGSQQLIWFNIFFLLSRISNKDNSYSWILLFNRSIKLEYKLIKVYYSSETLDGLDRKEYASQLQLSCLCLTLQWGEDLLFFWLSSISHHTLLPLIVSNFSLVKPDILCLRKACIN